MKDSKKMRAVSAADQVKVRRNRKMLAVAMLMPVLVASVTSGQNDVSDHGGPVMQAPTVFTIYWLPNGKHFDPSGAAGDQTYQNVINRFFTDISGTNYLNIVSQYPGICSPPNIPVSQPCFGPVTFGGSTLDTRAYPHTGSANDPLQDSDIQTEVSNFIAAQGLTPGLNMEFFVFTAANINECAPFGCTGSDFCAYHGDFQSNGNTVIYAYMPSDDSWSGCQESISKGPNLLSADRDIVAASHEFAESWSDPRVNDSLGWNDSLTGNEIGDNCVPWISPTGLGNMQSNGSNVTLNGNPYVVQEEWSNDDEGCVLNGTAIPGPSIEYTMLTGGDDLRGDSSAASNLGFAGGASFETVALKAQPQPGWSNNSTHFRVFQLSQTQPADVAVTLTSHASGAEGPDNWDIQSLDLKLRNPNGSLICEQMIGGSPLARLTGQAPTATFATPNCAPPAPPASITKVTIAVSTGNDNARSDTELWATLPGEPSFCLKPSNNAEPDGVCANGGSAADHNGKQSWDNWTASAQSFAVPSPQPSSVLTNLKIKLIEHNSWTESDDNWDIQGITVTTTDSDGSTSTVLNITNPPSGDNCIARLKGSPNATTVSFTLDGTNGHTYVDGNSSEAGETTTCHNNGD